MSKSRSRKDIAVRLKIASIASLLMAAGSTAFFWSKPSYQPAPRAEVLRFVHPIFLEPRATSKEMDDRTQRLLQLTKNGHFDVQKSLAILREGPIRQAVEYPTYSVLPELQRQVCAKAEAEIKLGHIDRAFQSVREAILVHSRLCQSTNSTIAFLMATGSGNELVAAIQSIAPKLTEDQARTLLGEFPAVDEVRSVAYGAIRGDFTDQELPRFSDPREFAKSVTGSPEYGNGSYDALETVKLVNKLYLAYLAEAADPNPNLAETPNSEKLVMEQRRGLPKTQFTGPSIFLASFNRERNVIGRAALPVGKGLQLLSCNQSMRGAREVSIRALQSRLNDKSVSN